ncbi:Abnormal spindle-like microcephaly-associated protein [Penicillium rolfsii]|nr:Abnormal spindle-like microcephaly-associated protein [Penicillium rolfsii]
MSGILNQAFTPCPSRSRSSGLSEHGGNESFDGLFDNDSGFDTTAQIEFTTEIRAPVLTGVRPRRANRATNTVQIYEDISEKQPGPVEKRGRPNAGHRDPSERKSILLAQPAQRFRPKANFAPSPPLRRVKPETETQPKARYFQSSTDHGLRSIPQPTQQVLNERNKELKERNKELKKNIRRNTVYIPPDDTTVASVFMGLFSPVKKSHGNSMPQVAGDTQVNTVEAQLAKRQARKSVAKSAFKAPLQPSVKVAQEAAFRIDVAGKGGGKENIPPGSYLEVGQKGKLHHTVQSQPKRSSKFSSKPARRTTMHKAEKGHSTNLIMGAKKQPPKQNVLGEKENNEKDPPSSLFIGNKVRAEPQDHLRDASTSLKARASVLSERLGHSRTLRASRIEDTATLREINKQYPLLMADISKPALYEDDWLSHQETVITQLINTLFERTNKDSTVSDSNTLRLELLEIYQTEEFSSLYERLKSSLSYGNLSLPKDIQAHKSRLQHDVGLRREFFDVWIQSYDLRALVPALETVVGRRVSSDPTLFNVQNNLSFENDFKVQRVITRKVEGFIDTFLLRNDDMIRPAPGLNDVPMETVALAYRRTVLRSIMLVALLDHGRQKSGTSLPRRLFLSSSLHKSSADILHALGRLLLPSGGDITKSLNHIGCHVNYRQHELQEYDFMIGNIAVDLRDGVRLTRLVEILFYTSEHMRTGIKDQTEVTFSCGKTLSLLDDQSDLPLSKHLKYPCIHRAAKIHNVQIALSALSSVNGGQTVFDGVSADHIVDGYREKTIALLWALVSKFGLPRLVDWEDVRKEIGRMQRKAAIQLGQDLIRQEACFTRKESENASLLLQWATILAALNGLEIGNMTTHLVDGKIYGSIVDEYEPFITGRGTRDCDIADRRSDSMSLASRLRLLGCSSQFASLVCPGKTYSHILDEDVTIGSLAYLCSRLLAASKRARAAVVLQRFWRTRLAVRDESRRKIAHDLAAHCAAVIQTRSQIIWAKGVISRHWRNYQIRKQRSNSTRYRAFEKPNRQH